METTGRNKTLSVIMVLTIFVLAIYSLIVVPVVAYNRSLMAKSLEKCVNVEDETAQVNGQCLSSYLDRQILIRNYY